MHQPELTEAFAERDAVLAGVEERSDDVLARFWAKVDRRASSKCWPWLGARNGKGYGGFTFDGAYGLAHRFAYELCNGPIPAGHWVDHLCRNTWCVNPDHLEAVTPAENTNRGYSAALAPAAQREKTCCPRGHSYNDANTYYRDGRRHCRACRTLSSREHATRKRERRRAEQEKDAALGRVEQGSAEWERAVIDQAIAEYVARGHRFSANDVRGLLPEVRRALIGARFLAAARRGEIRRLTYEKSTDPGTHGHPVAVWIAAGSTE